MSHRRKGKVAQLPKETRDTVNRLLQDGHTYAAIVARLAELGHPDFNEMNISNWKEGGYGDWLREQERLEDMRAKREFAMEIVKANEGSQIHEATLQLAASQLYEVLTEFDLGNLKGLLAEKPSNYAKIVNALSKLSEGGLKYERYRSEVEERKRAIADQLTRAKADGLTAETLTRIEEELRLL
jgi:hypothetical protein